MKIINKGLLLTSTLLISTALSAAPYINGQVGGYGAGDNNAYKNVFDNHHGSKIKATGRAGVGYAWDLNENVKVGIEGGINGYQKSRYASRRTSVDALGVINAYVAPKVNVFGKGGAAYVNQDYSLQPLGYNLSNKKSHKVVPKAAAGVGYDIAENLNLNLSVSHEFEKNQRYTKIPAATAVLVGLQYSFK